MKKHYTVENNDILFGADYYSNKDENELRAKANLAKQLVKDCGENEVFEAWSNYLDDVVKTKKEAESYASWFFAYDGINLHVKNPYHFLAMLFCKLELSLKDPKFGWGNEATFYEMFDTFYVYLLINAGLAKKDDYFYLDPYSDKRLEAEIARLVENSQKSN